MGLVEVGWGGVGCTQDMNKHGVSQSVESRAAFRRNVSAQSSGSKNKSDIKQNFACYLLHPYFLLRLFFDAGLRCWWVDNIRMDLGEVGWGDVDWIGLAKDRNRWRGHVNSVLNLRVP
jgi:hypothetical protein